MNTLHVKTGDTVVVLSGKEKDKQGKVMTVDPKAGLVIVEGLNIQTKHKKARKQGEESSIVKREGAIKASKVMRICPKCGKPTRLAHGFDDKGEKCRVCKKCGACI